MQYNRVYELRIKKGLSKEALAEILGCSPMTIGAWESPVLRRKVHNRYFSKLSATFDLPINEIVWEVDRIPSIVFDEWDKTVVEEKCENCENYDSRDYEIFGICKCDKQIKRFIDKCNVTNAFVVRESEKPKPPSFFRPKIDCHCGNCVYLKQREGLLTCVNADSDYYLKAVGTSGTCVKWVDLQLKCRYEDFARILPEKEFPFSSRLKAVRELREISIEDVCSKLDISVERWKAYESAIDVMTIDELVRFAEYSKVDVYYLLGQRFNLE